MWLELPAKNATAKSLSKESVSKRLVKDTEQYARNVEVLLFRVDDRATRLLIAKYRMKMAGSTS